MSPSSLVDVEGSSLGASFAMIAPSFLCTGRGVPDLLGTSSLPITSSGSNSEGSGPFSEESSSFLRAARLFGEPARREDLFAPEFDLDGDC